MTDDFVLPRYDGGALCNVLPSVEARLVGEPPIIDVPRANKYVIVMVDGLGLDVMHQWGNHA